MPNVNMNKTKLVAVIRRGQCFPQDFFFFFFFFSGGGGGGVSECLGGVS